MLHYFEPAIARRKNATSSKKRELSQRKVIEDDDDNDGEDEQGERARVSDNVSKDRDNSPGRESDGQASTTSDSGPAELHPADARYQALDSPGWDRNAPFPPHRGWPTVGYAKQSSASRGAPSRQHQHQGVKLQHFHVLNTILYKCLFTGDYARARRAFGLLLRLDLSGDRMDLRKKGLWEVGAEILLYQPEAKSDGDNGDSPLEVEEDDEAEEKEDRRDDGDTGEAGAGDAMHHRIPDANFAAARRFLERLILQYPPAKGRKQDRSAQTFYPVLVSLWMAQARGRSAKARAELARRDEARGDETRSDARREKLEHRRQRQRQRQLQREGQGGESGASSSRDGPSSDQDSGIEPDYGAAGAQHERQRAAALREITLAELSQAEALFARIEQVTFQPPYDRDARMMRLKGEVAAWAAELEEGAAGAEGSAPDEDSRLRRKGAKRWRREARAAYGRAEKLSGEEAGGGDVGNESDEELTDDDGAMEVDDDSNGELPSAEGESFDNMSE